MTILDQINIAIQDQTGNNHPPQRVTITKTYQNNPNLCDIRTKTGNKLTKIPVQGTPQINTEALLIYEDGDQEKPIIIPNTDTKQDLLVSGTNIKTINHQTLLGAGNITIQGGGGGDTSVIGTGSFTINENGHLIVELPNAVDNPYYINQSGHLIYDTTNTHNEGAI